MRGNRRERMESSVSVSDFEPLVEVLESVSTEEVVSTVPELTEGILSRDSQRMECTAVRRRRHTWPGRFPCGVCGKGVRNGLRCMTC